MKAIDFSKDENMTDNQYENLQIATSNLKDDEKIVGYINSGKSKTLIFFETEFKNKKYIKIQYYVNSFFKKSMISIPIEEFEDVVEGLTVLLNSMKE